MKTYEISTTKDDQVKEAAVAYQLPFKRILYNYESPLISDKTLMTLSRKGLDREAFTELASYMGITQEKLSQLLHTSLRNIQRKGKNELLDTLKSQQLMELAAFSRRATEVLGSQEAMKAWLQSPISALDFETPISMLDNTFGIKILTKILGRLEHGVYS